MNPQKSLPARLSEIRRYWREPPPGRYMPIREIAALSVGGIGVRGVTYCVSGMVLYVGNTLIGNTIGIAPTILYVIYLISTLANFPLTGLRAKLIDGVKNKKGKYRPYILSMGLPTAVLAIGFTYMPYERMTDTGKCVAVLLFNIGFQFFYQFYLDSYNSITNVLSPNTIERSDACTVKTVADGITPSVANILLPLVAQAVTGTNKLFDMRVYRVMYPPMIIAGFLLSLLIYVGTKEKIVQARTHFIPTRFFDALMAVGRNKYFWIISGAGWLGFLESAYIIILSWLYNYQDACSAGEYSLITAINGNASLWPVLAAPLLIRLFGKRNLLIVANLLNIAFILSMYPVIRYGNLQGIVWIMLVCMFVNSSATALGGILGPGINGDIRDYQHYITGERIDGMFVTAGLIGSVVSIGTGLVLPLIYEKSGLNKTVALSLGYDGSNVYDVLNNPVYFRSICGVLVLASAIGAVMNVVPYFFYDLTETKQKAMITVLKLRALFEDYSMSVLSDESLTEIVDIIEESKALCVLTPQPVSGTLRARRAVKRYNEKIAISHFIVREIEKYSAPSMQTVIERAEQIVQGGAAAFSSLETIRLSDARALPKSTSEEREARRAAIAEAREETNAKRMIKKHYPDGLTEFDESVFVRLFAAQDENTRLINEAAALNKKERKTAVTALRREKAKLDKELKNTSARFSVYHSAVKPLLDAKRLLAQRDNYTRYEEIKARYACLKK